MARKSKANTSAGSNQITLPAEKDAAAREVFKALLRIGRELKGYSNDVKTVLAEVKAAGGKPAQIRLASRLEMMTPEKRVKWEETVSGALAYLGYSALDFDGREPETKFRSHIDRVTFIEEQRRDLAETQKLWWSAAKKAGLDTVAMRELFRKARTDLDQIELQEWFDSLDRTAKSLGMWDAKSFDNLLSPT